MLVKLENIAAEFKTIIASATNRKIAA